jgi:uncharacterized protein (DUF486 family)
MKTLTLALLYLGSVFYILAQYGHLLLTDWTISKAMIIALPLVLIEYVFVLNGTHSAKISGENPLNILLLVMCFNFVNIYIFGKIAFGDKTTGKDFLAFGLILLASALTYKPIEDKIVATVSTIKAEAPLLMKF